jgi:hypothetical protein
MGRHFWVGCGFFLGGTGGQEKASGHGQQGRSLDDERFQIAAFCYFDALAKIGRRRELDTVRILIRKEVINQRPDGIVVDANLRRIHVIEVARTEDSTEQLRRVFVRKKKLTTLGLTTLQQNHLIQKCMKATIEGTYAMWRAGLCENRQNAAAAHA